MKEVDDCKRVLEESRDGELSGKDFKKENVIGESGPSVSLAVLYRRDALAVSRKHMAISFLHDVLFQLAERSKRDSALFLARRHKEK